MNERRITEATVLRAFANPARLRLLDVLRAHGPATVGALADRVDEAVGSVSHHLKVLADADLVQEAPELARNRRERWWRVAPGRASWTRGELDASARRSALAAEEMTLQRQFELVRAGMHDPDPRFAGATFANSAWLTLTPEQIRELGERITGLVDEFRERSSPPAEDAEPVLFFARTVHTEP